MRAAPFASCVELPSARSSRKRYVHLPAGMRASDSMAVCPGLRRVCVCSVSSHEGKSGFEVVGTVSPHEGKSGFEVVGTVSPSPNKRRQHAADPSFDVAESRIRNLARCWDCILFRRFLSALKYRLSGIPRNCCWLSQ